MKEQKIFQYVPIALLIPIVTVQITGVVEHFIHPVVLVICCITAFLPIILEKLPVMEHAKETKAAQCDIIFKMVLIFLLVLNLHLLLRCFWPAKEDLIIIPVYFFCGIYIIRGFINVLRLVKRSRHNQL